VATAFGLVGIAVFIACVVALAAGVTWLVVKISPNPNKKRAKAAEAAKPS
jgi:hypothetical protein